MDRQSEFFLYGASGHGKVVLEIVEQLGITIGGFIDANPEIKFVLGYPVLREVPGLVKMFISIGNNKTRSAIATAHSSCIFPVLLHSNAWVSPRVRVGAGTVVMSGATIHTEAEIGEHCIINTNASVDHECIISDFVHVSPNVALAGDVVVGEGTHIGIGACVIQGVRIGKWCTIGAGAVIIRDVPDYAVVIGNPGRIIRSTTDFTKQN